MNGRRDGRTAYELSCPTSAYANDAHFCHGVHSGSLCTAALPTSRTHALMSAGQQTPHRRTEPALSQLPVASWIGSDQHLFNALAKHVFTKALLCQVTIA